MEDNGIRTASETREDNNGGAVEMQDNRDGRKYHRGRQRQTSMVTEMRDNRNGYDSGGYVGRKHTRCGMKEMVKWVGRTATDLEKMDREQLPT